MRIFTTVTNAAYHDALKEDATEGATCWTINKHARPGDAVVLYVCAPVSAIVATAFIADEPYLDDNVNSEWFGSFFAPMEELRLLDVSITRHQLRGFFPDWGYWKQPRNSVQVPTAFEQGICDMVGLNI